MSIGGHHSARRRSDDWITPRFLIERLGPFDLDPCGVTDPPWPTAARTLTIADDGLRQDWQGLVWCNPPYGPETYRWLNKCARHGNALALVFARTETAGFFSQVWERADALLFIRKRLTFLSPDGAPAPGNSGGPSVLIAYGETPRARLEKNYDLGAFVRDWWK